MSAREACVALAASVIILVYAGITLQARIQRESEITRTFRIDLLGLEEHPDLLAPFESATRAWERMITRGSGAPNLTIPAGTSLCNGRITLTSDLVVSDLAVWVLVQEMDGVGGTLGAAGPCVIINQFPRVAIVLVDREDVPRMHREYLLSGLFKHELGHSLGLGTLWRESVTYSADGSYLLEGANKEDSAVRRDGGVAIVASGGGHWDEGLYDHELMTPYIEKGGHLMPLSRLSLGAMEDLGYEVDKSVADPYNAEGRSRRRLRARDKVALEGCILHNL